VGVKAPVENKKPLGYRELPQTDPVSGVHMDVIKIKNHCRPMAETLAKENDDDLLSTAAESSDFRHRVAAGWAYGLTLKSNEAMFKLLIDESPYVRLAAREGCQHIALYKYGANVDFGPAGDAETGELADSRMLWELYFKKKEKQFEERKKVENDKKSEKKDVKKILGIE
jgi:hypothetical protein